MFDKVIDSIKLFSTDRKRMLALILILIFGVTITLITSYFTTDNCTPLIDQNSALVKSQNELTIVNSEIIKKNRELVNGYIEIQDILRGFKKDTIFITKTIERSLTYPVENLVEFGSSENGDSVFFDEDIKLKSSYEITEVPILVSTTIKKTINNSEKLIDKINKIVDENKDIN